MHLRTKFVPFKKGPKLIWAMCKRIWFILYDVVLPSKDPFSCLNRKGDKKRMIKNPKQILPNIVSLWDCPCRVPAYAHDGTLLSWRSKQGEKMRAIDNFQDIITLCDVLCLWLSRSLCPWWPNLHNQQIPPRGGHQSTGCIKIVFIIFLCPNSIWFGMVCYVWYVIWCLMLVLWSSLITKLVCYLTWKHNKSENRQHRIMCSCKTRFSWRD